MRGGGGWHGSPFTQPPLPLLGRRAGRGVWTGAALPVVPGGGGPTPTYLAHNDPHVAIILTTHMWGENFFLKKNFPGQNLCSSAFGGNIRPYTKTKGPARKPISGTPPPPPPSPGAHAIPPPQSNFGRLMREDNSSQHVPWTQGKGILNHFGSFSGCEDRLHCGSQEQWRCCLKGFAIGHGEKESTSHPSGSSQMLCRCATQSRFNGGGGVWALPALRS